MFWNINNDLNFEVYYSTSTRIYSENVRLFAPVNIFSSELYAEFRYSVYMYVLTHSESYIEIHSYCIEI